MKRFTLPSILAILALLLSACQFHTGLGKLFNPNAAAPTKHVKATHTPPSPPNASAQTPAPNAANSNTVTISNTGFQPGVLQVKVGTTVTWTNSDTAAHTVTSDTIGLFDSGPVNAGGTFTFIFTQAGTFPYHSTGDTNWKSTITVTP